MTTVTLGAHTQALTPAAKAGIARGLPAVLKIVGTPCLDVGLLTDWRRARPAGTLIYREPFDDEDLTEPDARTNQLLANAERIRHLAPLLETPWNEVAGQGGALLDLYAAVTVQAVRRIAAAGYRAVIGNFAEGNPGDLSQWTRFLPALRCAAEHGGYLGLHEYGSPTLQADASWRALRFERVYNLLPADCRLPLIVTEFGLDWTGREPPNPEWGNWGFGWRAFGIDVADYAAQIRWYMSECQRIVASGLVESVHVVVFGYGCFPDWASFDTAGEPKIEVVLAEYSTVDAPTIDEEEDNMAYAVGPGIAAKMAEQGDEPASNEWYPQWEWCLAFGASGKLYTYLKKTNTVHVFLPAS